MSKKEKSKIFSNMKNLLNETKIEKKETYEISKKEIETIINIDILKDMTNDEKIINLLINSSIELFQIQIKNVIELGKIFKNVFDELGGEGSKYTGLYEKWLGVNNISKSTALRYRKRYEIYSNVIQDKRNIVTLLSQKYIELIYLEENREEYINLINKGATTKDIIEMLESKNSIEIEKKEEIEIVDYSFKEYKDIFKNIDKKSELLKEKEKLEIKKHLDKINKILNKNK